MAAVVAPLAGVRLAIAVTASRSADFYAGQLAALSHAGASVWFLSSPSSEVEAQCASEGAAFVPIAIERAPAPWSDVRALVAVDRALRRIRPELVVAGTPKMGLLAMVAAAAQRIPVRVHTLHGLRYETTRGAIRGALWTAQRVSCAAATHVVCVGPSLRARARASHLLGPTEGIVIGDGSVNGIDVGHYRADGPTLAAGQALRARLGIPPATTVVGYLGRLARDKGIGDLRRAWTSTRNADRRLLIGGTLDETDRPEVEDLVALEADPTVRLLGHVDDAATFLAALDVLVLPTWREGFPTVPLEAAAMGIPVVATHATGCADAVVDGVTGTLVPVHDAAALAVAIDQYVRDPGLRVRHGAEGAARVRAHFSRERVHRATIETYRTLVTRATP
ncbi:MAG: glycosyltransferase family 4 protein [Deltaproteobacteria bacterium]|nr:glycosyltransferase family 4 protein [Kofleriaceae bacterium]